MPHPSSIRLVLSLLLAAIPVSALSATTIAHWTDFSGATVQDTTANNLDLFQEPVNTSGSDWYATDGDNALFTSNSLTLEVIVAPTMISGSLSTFIAGQFRSDQTEQRAYALIINKDSKLLQLALSANGSAATVLSSTFPIQTGKTYYMGASFDVTSANSAERTATIYLQDLSTPGAVLQQQTFSGIAMTSIFNSNSPFALGAMGSGASEQYFAGAFTEARLTQGVLGAGELLIAIPEPSTAGLVLAVSVLGCAMTRRRGK